MAEYHFVSTWWIRAPIERVWEEIFQTERWPSWWKYVVSVDELEPGAADGVGRRQHLLFKTRLPYRLGFDLRVTAVQPPSTLEADATGELEGTGRWMLTSDEGGTLVRYNWDVRTTRWWMNLLAPVARPAFNWNHDELMREGGESLARRLGVELQLPDAPSRPRRSAGAARWWLVLVAAVVALTVLGRRRRARPAGGRPSPWR
jgi:Polyketide cyclase / dehydrase and lipid transport